MGRNAHAERDARLQADRNAVLTQHNTAEFIDQFAPITPIRRQEFESKLAALIDAHCLEREFAVINQAATLTAKELGSKGGEKGGPARARSLSPEQRRELAIRAVNARWHGVRKQQAEAAEIIRSFHARKGKMPSRRALAKALNCSTSSAARYLKAAENQGADF